MQPSSLPNIQLGASSYSPTQVASYFPDQLQPTQIQQNPAGMPAPAPQEAWWKKLLPTVGSIAAPLIGTALAPVTGGTSLLLGAGLAGLGAGAGKVAENVLTGKEATKDVGREALTTGGLSLLTGGIGKAAGKLVTKAAPTFEKGAARMFAGQAVPGSVSEETATMMTKLGLRSPEEAAQLGKVLTGSTTAETGSHLSKGVKDAVINFHSAQPQKYIQFDDFQAAFGGKPLNKALRTARGESNFVTQSLNRNALSDASSSETLRKQAQSIFTKATGEGQTISGRIGPEQALQAQKDYSALENTYRQAFNKNGDVRTKNIADFYGDMNQELKSRLGLSLDPGSTPIPISKEELGTLAQQIRASGARGADQIAARLETDPTITTWAHVRQIESPFVEVSQAAQKTAREVAKKFGITLPETMAAFGGLQTAGPVGAGMALGAAKAIESPTAAKLATGALSKAAEKAASGKLPSVLGRMGALGGGALGTVPGWAGDSLSPTAGPFGGGNMQNQGMGGMGMGQPISQLYDTLYRNYLAGGPAATGSSNLASVLAGLAPQAQLTGELNRLTGGLGAAYLGAGGPQGLLGGLGALATGFIPGTPANLYNRQQAGVASLLQNLYGIPAGVGAGLTPQLTQGAGTAGIAAGNLGL